MNGSGRSTSIRVAGRQVKAKYGEVWDTRQLAHDFIVIGFAAPYIVVQRKSDGVKGSLEFQNLPRFYFNFRADK